MKEVDLLQVLKSLHSQEGPQQWGSPQIIIMIELEAEDLELASRASELLENFDPLTIARVGNSRGGELFVYLQSEASKVDLIPLADPSEPLMCIGGALVSLVS